MTTAPVSLVPETSGFHNHLRELLQAKGWTEQRGSLEASLYAGAISRYLREGAYPLPDAFEPLAQALGASSGSVDAWLSEAKAARPRHEHVFAMRAKHRRASEPIALNCARCGQTFLAVKPSPRYCSVYCKYEERGRWVIDTDLKARFLAKVRHLKISVRPACAEADATYSSVRGWLKRDEGRLKEPALAAVAAWLGISLEEATKLQGGTAEAKRLEATRQGLASSEKVASYRQKLRTNRRFQRQVVNRMAEAVRGHEKSPDHRKKISIALKTYRQGKSGREPHPLGQHNRTMRGRAQNSLKNFLRRTPQPTRAQIREWAGTVRNRLGLSVARVLESWRPGLERRGLWSRAGRKANERRHGILQQLKAMARRTATGKLAQGFWAEAAKVVSQDEDSAISGAELQVWSKRHERYCSGPDRISLA